MQSEEAAGPHSESDEESYLEVSDSENESGVECRGFSFGWAGGNSWIFNLSMRILEAYRDGLSMGLRIVQVSDKSRW